ncbi:MAG: AraC family transcriptional regulator [Bryobacterales bacterium]|nr:AraC family transcriptional regulator [Bryobacterales bacterium]
MRKTESIAEYRRRINRVIDYIADHLDEPLKLRTVAGVACFSEFHFHKIFSVLMGETLNDFVTRLRIEKALFLMRYNPRLTLTEVALECGFHTSPNFSRVFRKKLGVAPRDFDLQAYWQDRKIGKDHPFQSKYYQRELPPDEFEGEFTVSLQRFPELHFAYIRVFNSYAGGVSEAFARMDTWARMRGLMTEDVRFLGMSQDDPEITPLEKCRYDVCLTVPKGVRGEGEIQIRRLPAALYGVLRCTGEMAMVDRAWNYLLKVWLVRSGYQPAPLPAIEYYHRSPLLDGWRWIDFDACLPVKPL